MDTMTEAFEQYKTDEAICDCECAHCQTEQPTSELPIFEFQYHRFAYGTEGKLMAALLAWKHSRPNVLPVSVKYWREAEWHRAEIKYLLLDETI